jgi:hypothetical protein
MGKFAFGHSTALLIVFSASMQATVSETRTIATINMTGNGTLALSEDAKPTLGDEIILKVSSDGTARDLTFGTGFTAPVLTGVINKTKVITLVYDGTAFIPSGAAIQIN